MQVLLTRENGADKLQTDVPIRRQKVKFDWDPPTYTPSSNVVRGRIHVEDDEQ
jgi:cell division topological specificity factor